MFLSFLNREVTSKKLLLITILINFLAFYVSILLDDFFSGHEANLIDRSLNILFVFFVMALCSLLSILGGHVEWWNFTPPPGLVTRVVLVLIISGIWFLLRFGLKKRNIWYGKIIVLLAVFLWFFIGFINLSSIY